MQVKRAATMPTVKGPAQWFTGEVHITTPFQAEEPGRAGGATVTFQPGARTAWHTHPLGQSLIITAGVGWTQCEGEEIVEIRAGDVVGCPPGHKHWHGATPTSSMTHVAVAEMLDGRAVDWMKHVTDDEYPKGTDDAEA